MKINVDERQEGFYYTGKHTPAFLESIIIQEQPASLKFTAAAVQFFV